MAEALEKERPSDAGAPIDGDAGRAGTPPAGGDERSPAGGAAPPILTPEQFRVVGTTLNGKHWQADIGQLIGISRSQVTRYLNREREINAMVPRHLQYVVVERIIQLAHLMDLPGMPHAGSDEVKQAIAAIVEAAQKAPGQEPPRNH